MKTVPLAEIEYLAYISEGESGNEVLDGRSLSKLLIVELAVKVHRNPESTSWHVRAVTS